MKIELVQLYFTVKPPGSAVTATSYSAKEFIMTESDRGIRVKHRSAPTKVLLVPWANVCGVWYEEAVTEEVKPDVPPPTHEGGRFRKAG